MNKNTTSRYPSVSKDNGGSSVFASMYYAGITGTSVPSLILIEPNSRKAIYNMVGYHDSSQIKYILDSIGVPNKPVSLNFESNWTLIKKPIDMIIQTQNGLELIVTEKGNYNISIYTMNGREIFTRNIGLKSGVNKIKFDKSQLANQVLNIRVVSNKTSISKKMIIR
jgi:hypothetical protein